MITANYILIATLSLLFIFLVVRLLRHFGRGNDLIIYFVTPLLIYSFGYILRLSGDKPLVDLGFYMTDYSFMFVYTIFAVSILLGQLRYWKK